MALEKAKIRALLNRDGEQYPAISGPVSLHCKDKPPPPNREVPFSQLLKRNHSDLPGVSGCYAFVRKDSLVLRVGKSKCLTTRIKGYPQNTDGSVRRFMAYAKEHASELTIQMWLCDNIDEFEGELIKYHNPPFNVHGKAPIVPQLGTHRLTLELTTPLYLALQARTNVIGQSHAAFIRALIAEELKEELRNSINNA